ncbi:MAG TPA: thiamine phosphate synthase [Pyrinomonadaceae bacterium]|nr:thiamine phosphate synthase [Pyrinomonadaceae bacterium]
MAPELSKPIIYLITSGRTTAETTRESPEFHEVLSLVRAAVQAKVTFLQIREKHATDRTLFHLVRDASDITRDKGTRILVNGRADIARAGNVDGVHLPTRSLPVDVVRKTFGEAFLIGASTHSVPEIVAARESGADFAVFGPVFDTPSKPEAVGLTKLREAAFAAAGFPLLALGGVNPNNARECFRAGASGVAAIRMFSDPEKLESTVKVLQAQFEEYVHE